MDNISCVPVVPSNNNSYGFISAEPEASRPRPRCPGRDRFIPSSGEGVPRMHRYVKLLLYGVLAFAVFAGISFAVGGRVNWELAVATAVGVMIAYFFAAPRRGR